jgi:hypothetical protein
MTKLNVADRQACVVLEGDPRIHWRSGHYDISIYPDDLRHGGGLTECTKGLGDSFGSTYAGTRDPRRITCFRCLVVAVKEAVW